MKSLLISLMAFLCVLGVNATPSGSGTKEDPYVIADGDTYVVNTSFMLALQLLQMVLYLLSMVGLTRHLCWRMELR